MTDNKLITQEQQELLSKHAREFSGRTKYSSVPRLKVAKEADPINSIAVGDFVLTKKMKDEATGEWRTKTKGLGKTPTVTILLMRMCYSWFDSSSGKYVIQTNEFNSFEPDERIIVFDEGKVTHDIGYAEFKKLKETEWRMTNPRGGSKSALKLSYILYIAIGEKIIAAFTVPISSYVGVTSEGKRDFKNPEAGSLMALQNNNPNVAPYAYSIQLSAEEKSFTNKESKQKIVFFRTVFTKADESNLVEMLVKRQELEQALTLADNAQYERGQQDRIVSTLQDEAIAEPAVVPTAVAPVTIGPDTATDPVAEKIEIIDDVFA